MLCDRFPRYWQPLRSSNSRRCDASVNFYSPFRNRTPVRRGSLALLKKIVSLSWVRIGYSVDRLERDIDAAELTQLLFRQHVMQMTDMHHAEIGGLENEHGVAIRHPTGDIGQVGRYVADPHVFDKQIMPRDTALRIPAA